MIRAKTSCIAGDLDPLVGPDGARELASQLPRPTPVKVMADTGHDPSLERPVELADLVMELIESCEA